MGAYLLPRLTAAASLLAVTVMAAAHEADVLGLGFSEGTVPVHLMSDGTSKVIPAERCGQCHEEQYAAWLTSRHRVSHSNAIYQAGLVAEPKTFCVYCHAPLAEQSREVMANIDWYAAHDPRNGLPTPGERLPEPTADEGITCTVCHWRDGVVLSTVEPTGGAPHPTRRVEGLGSPDLCRSCHEFRMPVFVDGGMTMTDVPMQSTFTEWQAYADAGGEGTCQSCHMPDGAHTFRGAHDHGLLADSVEVKVRRARGVVRFEVSSVGVGHHVPTGDLFRNLTLEVAEEDGDFEVIDRMGREFAVIRDASDGETRKELSGDTSLRPGRPRIVEHEASGRLRWRMRYHYGAEHDELRGLVPLQTLIVTLWQGEIRVRAPR